MAHTCIEDFLGFHEDEVEERVQRLRAEIPTSPGTGYLEVAAKAMEVQPWPFIRFLLYNHPDLLNQGLGLYKCYDGNENVAVIMDQLRADYILWKCYELLQNERTERP